MSESFTEFRISFSYGSRSNLNFKFLKGMSDEAAAEFIEALFQRVSDVLDGADIDLLRAQLLEGQTAVYGTPHERYTYPDGPFAPLDRPLREARLLLLTSSGHFVAGHDPQPFGVEEMTQAEAEARINDFLREAPTLSRIPVDTPADQLRVRHGGYDIAAAAADHNVALPLDALRALLADGTIGALLPDAYSFVGAAAQTPLIKTTGPQWAAQFKDQGVEAALLVPV